MKKLIFFLIYFSAIQFQLQSQTQKYWIYFKNKDLVKPSEVITERAIERRKKMSENIFSEEDYPISKKNLEILEKGKIINQSNWLNAVSVILSDEEKNTLIKNPEIKSIEPVVTLIRKKEINLNLSKENNFSIQKSQADLLNYGESYNQLKQINVVDVHNLRVNGKGILVGMLDSGFRWKIHESTKNLKVIAEYDFIQKDSVTSFQNGDSYDQDHHGTTTMSALGGFYSGKLIGPAYQSEFILGKTEYVPSETNIEEDNWAAGIEWMENRGVDVVSSSLGYSLFDGGQRSYTYADMNGRTAITTKAALIAARKGVVVCTAMGNEGNDAWKYLVAPADADSIIAVGAVNSSGKKTGFSSFGPTSDGRIKPELCALGSGVFSANASSVYPGVENFYGYNSGTSLSTPLVAGSVALFLSAFPELNPIQVRNYLQQNASNNLNPDTLIGWGVLNLLKAMHAAGIIISPDPEKYYTTTSNYQIGFYLSSNSEIKKDSVFLYYSKNKNGNFKSVPMQLGSVINPTLNTGKYIGMIPRETTDQTIEYYLIAKDISHGTRNSPYNAPTKYYTIPSIPMNVDEIILPMDYELYQNYPNPFNPKTIIKYDLPKNANVKITISDLLGREIKILSDGFQIAGNKSIIFYPNNLASGTYFYKIETEGFTKTKKMILLK